MQTSTLLKVSIVGMFISVLACFVPLIAALFGNDSLSLWMNKYVNETDATELLIFFSVIIIYAMVKKGRQQYLEELFKNSNR